jgi:hypothetical protein
MALVTAGSGVRSRLPAKILDRIDDQRRADRNHQDIARHGWRASQPSDGGGGPSSKS